jgi:hypothetical protein
MQRDGLVLMMGHHVTLTSNCRADGILPNLLNPVPTGMMVNSAKRAGDASLLSLETPG